MEKITLEALLRIRDLAACAVRHPDICATAELALLELNWRSMMVFSLLFDMQSETYVPVVLWRKFQTALEDCTSEAQEELRREYSELMETENYGRQVEICNRLNQLREADR